MARRAPDIDQDVSDAVDINELPEIDRLAAREPGEHPLWTGRDLAQHLPAAVVTTYFYMEFILLTSIFMPP
jgi:hypothetical protein